MNIFVLDHDPVLAAQMHVDKHVVKMCVELTQQLVAAVRRHGATDADVPLSKSGNPYRESHKNHPCTLFCGYNRGNFEWAALHALALCEEYTYRYNKRHACQSPLEQLQSMATLIPSGPLTKFALAMPDEYKMDCPIRSYRSYYFFNKSKKMTMKWSNRNIPFWFANNYFGGLQ